MDLQDIPTIRLDRSKPFQTVHGERQPDDPHYGVAAFQGKLPFDSEERLILPDGKTAPWVAQVDLGDGKMVNVRHHPLYNEKMKAILEAKVNVIRKRLAGPVLKASAPVEDGEERDPDLVAIEQEEAETKQSAEAEAEGDVNLAAWLRGEQRYQGWELTKAMKDRFSVNQTKVADMVRFLVEEQKVVPRDKVCREYRKFLGEA